MIDRDPSFDARVRSALDDLDPSRGDAELPSSLSASRGRAESLARQARVRRATATGIAASVCVVVFVGVMLRSGTSSTVFIDPGTTVAAGPGQGSFGTGTSVIDPSVTNTAPSGPATSVDVSTPSSVDTSTPDTAPQVPGPITEVRRVTLPDGFGAAAVLSTMGSLWVAGGWDGNTSTDDVLRIDPATGDIVHRYDTRNWVSGLVESGRKLYAVTVPPDGGDVPEDRADPRLVQIDPATDNVTELPVDPALLSAGVTVHVDLAATNEFIWFVSPITSAVTKWRVADSTVVWTRELSPGREHAWSPSIAANRDGTVWVAYGQQVFHLDADGNVVSSTPGVEGLQEVQLDTDGSVVWVSTNTGDVVAGVRLDNRGGTDTEPGPSAALISAPVDSGLIAMDEGVWVSLRTQTGAVDTRFIRGATMEPFGTPVEGRAADGHDGRLWTVSGSHANVIIEWDTEALIPSLRTG